MQAAVFINPTDVEDIRRGIAQLRQWEEALTGGEAAHASLREVLGLDASSLVRLAHSHYGTGRFTLPELATTSGQPIRALHGMTGPLGKACDSRGVEVFDRHGGQPMVLSVRPQVASLLESGRATAAN